MEAIGGRGRGTSVVVFPVLRFAEFWRVGRALVEGRGCGEGIRVDRHWRGILVGFLERKRDDGV